MNRCNGRESFRAFISGTAARHADTNPFMSAEPRAYNRPSLRRSVNGSALHACPSTGTVSTCPDSATPPGCCGPMIAWTFAFSPDASVLTRYGTPCVSKYSRTYAIKGRLELRLVVSNDTSRASRSVVLSRGPGIDAFMRQSLAGSAMRANRGGQNPQRSGAAAFCRLAG